MQTVIYGHRGARGLYPENTIEGFLYAAGLGLYGVELDVVISKDKKVVVSHEPWMNPKTCTKPDNSKVNFLKRKNLYRMNYNRIRRYDCGLRGNVNFPHQIKLPAYKPLLAEVIGKVEAFIKSNNLPPLVYNVEIKSKWVNDHELHPPPDEFVDLVLKELAPFNIYNRILIQSFDMRSLNVLHQKNPGCSIGMLVKNPRFIKLRMSALKFTPDTCGLYYKYATSKWIDRIHELGMKALVWTENEKEDMHQHILMGVDGIITDYPARALEVMAEQPK
ncbi:MAG TPA: glycerophosphodiester phosphodiesterase family protein [Bacteroidia bacterium]|jgi:glycerophosphoryl diester phosphodiesterase|nr:glycerophosphodiester phosphodiesterase family protein [Bacteroidia bacterium]